jgi:multidrug transporter EmrE-like cation transporter
MIADALPQAPRSRLARAARPVVWIAMPLLGVLNQYCAERVAHVLAGQALGAAWFAAAIRSPWMQAWVGLEVLTLAAWMIVLAELSLSAAFPMTAVGYVLVIGMGWTVLGEPISLLQLAGGAAILAGVWLLGQGEAQP